MFELKFAITEQQNFVPTGSRLPSLALGAWTIYSRITTVALDRESIDRHLKEQNQTFSGRKS